MRLRSNSKPRASELTSPRGSAATATHYESYFSAHRPGNGSVTTSGGAKDSALTSDWKTSRQDARVPDPKGDGVRKVARPPACPTPPPLSPEVYITIFFVHPRR